MDEKEYAIGFEKVHVKEWKKDIFIKPLSLEEELEWEKSVDKDKPGNSISQLVAMSICDEAGKPLWSKEEVGKLPAKIAQRLYFQSLKISGLRKKDFDALVKNFDADQVA